MEIVKQSIAPGIYARLLVPVTTTRGTVLEMTPGYLVLVKETYSASGTALIERDSCCKGHGPGLAVVGLSDIEPAYQIASGTYYDARTPAAVVAVLENARRTGQRVRIHTGDTATGRDWLEEFGAAGKVGRSMGPVCIPLLITSTLAHGGPGLLDGCIVKITTTTAPCRVLYAHPAYHHGAVTIRPIGKRETCGKVNLYRDGYRAAVDIGGENHANFKSEDKARRWVKKMGLTI